MAAGLNVPFSASDRARLFAGLDACSRVGVAVSGGPDSTALLILIDAWTRDIAAAPTLFVLSVDHGLRAQAAAEADGVVALAARLGHAGEKLVWRHTGPKPTSDIQAEARAARYRLLADAARSHQLDAVLLAHTRDDQAETVLMHLARGSGVAGLAAMPGLRWMHGVRFLRPLLDVPKAALLEVLEASGTAFVTDPSNSSERYTRVRIRKAMPALAELGLDAERLAGTARRMARAEAALRSITDDLIATATTDHGGVWSVDPTALAAAPAEIGLRLLVRLIRTIRPSEHPPRAEALETWHAAFVASAAPRRATLAGIVLDSRRHRLWLYAEAGRGGFEQLRVDGDGEHVWDGRLLVGVTGSGDLPLIITAGGRAARQAGLPPAAAASLPTVGAADSGQTPAGLTVTVRPVPTGGVSSPALSRRRPELGGGDIEFGQN